MEKTVRILSHSADETTALAAALVGHLKCGDVILMQGHIGGGKTHFVRSAIQALLGADEHVPSPTFTLVQTYDCDNFEVWHADLYRLSHPDEVFELGLIDAFETGVSFVEWPDRLADLAPASALTLDFAANETEGQRQITASWTDPRWDALADVLHV